jgi:hypothetical protein
MPITPMRSALPVDEGSRAQVVDGGAEILDEDVGGREVARLTAAVAVERRVEGESDEAAHGHVLGVDAGALLLDAAVGRADDDRRMLLGFVEVLGPVEVGRDRDPEPVLVRHRRPGDVLVQVEDVVVCQRHAVSFPVFVARGQGRRSALIARRSSIAS